MAGFTSEKMYSRVTTLRTLPSKITPAASLVSVVKVRVVEPTACLLSTVGVVPSVV